MGPRSVHGIGRSSISAPLRQASRRAVLAGASALTVGTAANVAAIAAAMAVAPDPVFAAVEASKRSWAQLHVLCGRVTDPEFDAACTADDDALAELIDTKPTTLSGVLAYLRHIRDRENGSDDVTTMYMDENETALGAMLATVIASLEELQE
jgi:hypothetical protein